MSAMPCPGKKVLHAYLTPEEYAQVKAQAEQAGISVSAFARRVCLGHELRSTADQQAVLALTKANGDLGRLGGLFKMALSEGRPDKMGMAFEFRQTLRRIEWAQERVASCCREVAESLKRK